MGVQRAQVLTTDSQHATRIPECDVVVVGAGPAGLLAARGLATRGIRVVVLEEHDRIGAPVHCTGVLGLEAFDELDLPRAAIVGLAQSARFVAPNGTSVVVEDGRVRAAVVDRERFDRALADSATGAGASLRTGERVATVEQTHDSVVVTTARGRVAARAAVLACGASYRFNRALGLGVPSVLVHSAQLEVPFPALEHVHVHFGRQVAPGGFAWIVPFSRDGAPFARVGLLCDVDAGAAFRAFATAVRTLYGIADAWPEPRLKALPLAPVERTWTDRIVAVGDAAGLVKPTTGGGIYYGLLTGHLAADVLSAALAENRLTGRALKEYERRWRARLGPEIRAGLAFRSIAARLTDTAIDRVVELSRVDGIVPLLRQTADFNWHGAAVRALLRHGEFRKIVFGAMFQ
jgi:digeranylgeranylglycerophospholipid reductase